jgi:hypothetical protein
VFLRLLKQNWHIFQPVSAGFETDKEIMDLSTTKRLDRDSAEGRRTYLIPARTGSEILVREIKLFDAEGTAGSMSVS